LAWKLTFLFSAGNVLIAAELLPNQPDSLTVNRKGQIKIGLKFREALAESVTAIVFVLYQSCIEIDRNKTVILDR